LQKFILLSLLVGENQVLVQPGSSLPIFFCRLVFGQNEISETLPRLRTA
jgi:hypothetical protein